MPNNWKLYFENVKDTYHASILHLFLTTFRINRLSMPGGIYIDRQTAAITTAMPSWTTRPRTPTTKRRHCAPTASSSLQDRSVVELVDEYGDGVSVQILTVFPGMVLQQVRNTIAVRVIRPRGVDKAELEWIHLGFDTDDEAMTERRLRQGNLIGAAGYISMEDGCVGGFVQRALQYNDEGAASGHDGRARGRIADLPRQRGGDPRLLEAIPRADGRVSMDDVAVRLGIHELIAEYAECIDEDRLEEWPDLFVDPCRYLVISRANHEAGLRQGVMYAASRGMLLDRVFSLRRANIFEPHRYRHVVGPIRLKSVRGRRRGGAFALHGGADHARRRDDAVRQRPLPGPDRRRRPRRSASTSGSSCSTATRSTRCWRSRCSGRCSSSAARLPFARRGSGGGGR